MSSVKSKPSSHGPSHSQSHQHHHHPHHPHHATDKEQPLHERLEEEELKLIHEIFMRAQKRLTSPQLRVVLKSVSKIEYNDEDWEVLFMKINSKLDGFCSWDEFISYLVLSYQQQEVKHEFESLDDPIPKPPIMSKSNHRYTINRIIYCPTVRQDRTISWQDGSLMTCSRDGTINYWSLDMNFERTVKSTCPNLKVQTTWVTDMVTLPDISVVATSSTERDLRFYDTSARKFELRVTFTSVDHAVTTMFYHFSLDKMEESILLLGDTGGNIHVVYIESVGRGPFKSKLGQPLLEVSYESVLKGNVEGFRIVYLPKQHTDYVRQIYFCYSLQAIVSCADCEHGLMMRNINESKDSYIYKTAKGAWCFSINEGVHLFASGGSDCLVKLWNPFVPIHPTATFYGHHAGITALLLQDQGKRLYSMSQDKYIKVWDVASQTCIQNYLGLPQELGEYSDLTTMYNPMSRQWIIGSTMLAILLLSPEQSGEHTDGFTHVAGVSVVLYNSLFKVIVTCGLDSNIIVWNPWDGRRLITIKEAHSKSVHAEIVPIEITAGAFDLGFQRLITGAHDGSIKIWNFNTGTCLRNMRLDDGCEVKSIIWLKARILAMGWNKRVTEFTDAEVGTGADYSKSWDLRHVEDISCAAVRIPQSLVTATYDGEVIMWLLETGQPYKQFNVSDPTTRIKIQYKPKKYKDDKPKSPSQGSIVPGRKSFLKGRPSVIPGGYGAKQLGGPPPQAASPGLTAKQAAMKARKVSVVSMPDTCIQMRKLAVHSMLFLDARTMDPNIGTLLIAMENGAVQVWSHHAMGGFITSFSAIHKAGDYVIAMTSDRNNEFLFVGTSIGYIKVWLLANYCSADPDMYISMPKYRLMFPFLWGDRFVGRAARVVKMQPKPMLLSSYKAHLMCVSDLAYIDEAKILLSSSVDFTVRMWSLGGQYHQTMGTFKKWKHIDPDPEKNVSFEHTVPPDTMRVASSTTLRVLGGGATNRTLTQKQLQAKVEKELTHVDTSKIFGERLTDPVLGHHYYRGVTKRAELKEIIFDTSSPYIPVYQHLIMPQAQDIVMPKIHKQDAG